MYLLSNIRSLHNPTFNSRFDFRKWIFAYRSNRLLKHSNGLADFISARRLLEFFVRRFLELILVFLLNTLAILLSSGIIWITVAVDLILI